MDYWTLRRVLSSTVSSWTRTTLKLFRKRKFAVVLAIAVIALLCRSVTYIAAVGRTHG